MAAKFQCGNRKQTRRGVSGCRASCESNCFHTQGSSMFSRTDLAKADTARGRLSKKTCTERVRCYDCPHLLLCHVILHAKCTQLRTAAVAYITSQK